AKTYRIRIALPDDTPLIVGMSVEANVVTRQKADALLVPSDAVSDGRVLVVDGDRGSWRQVAIGIRGTRKVEIVSGLAEDERIAAPAPVNLTDGARVRVTGHRPR